MNKFRKVCVLGLGYIGLPTAATIASKSTQVFGVDVNVDIVKTVNRGEIHINEPNLKKIVDEKVKKGQLIAFEKPQEADIYIITVPTPILKNKMPDLKFVKNAVRSISNLLKSGDILILESTSPVGTTRNLAKMLSKLRPSLKLPNEKSNSPDIHIGYCPERVLPGNIINELKFNDRLIGGMSKKCGNIILKFYKSFVRGKCVLASNPEIAEFAKLSENSFRDLNIAFANELSVICDDMNLNVWELINLCNLHPRVNILNPGPGVGGHCIALDPWFLISSFPKTTNLIKSARVVNETKVNWVIKKIFSDIKSLKKTKKLNDIILTFYGITYKPDVDDIRESPSIKIIKKIREKFNGIIQIVDPFVKVELVKIKNVSFVEYKRGIKCSDLNIFLVKHSDFLKQKKPTGKIIDTTGIWYN